MVSTVKRVIESDIEAPAIVLVEPTHPGNIGAVARAMANMGFLDLRLVKPQIFPSPVAKSMAAGADSILRSATVYDTLDEAIADCRYMIGTSARDRTIDWPSLTPAAAMKSIEGVKAADVAFVFGTERTGLSNAQLDRCNTVVRIPVNDNYGSINLATAAMLLCYEYRQSVVEPREAQLSRYEASAPTKPSLQPAPAELVHGFYRHAEHVLNEIRFLKVHPPVKLMRKILRLFNRARLTEEEVNILRGVLTTIEYELDHRGPRTDLPPESGDSAEKDATRSGAG